MCVCVCVCMCVVGGGGVVADGSAIGRDCIMYIRCGAEYTGCHVCVCVFARVYSILNQTPLYNGTLRGGAPLWCRPLYTPVALLLCTPSPQEPEAGVEGPRHRSSSTPAVSYTGGELATAARAVFDKVQ